MTELRVVVQSHQPVPCLYPAHFPFRGNLARDRQLRGLGRRLGGWYAAAIVRRARAGGVSTKRDLAGWNFALAAGLELEVRAILAG